MAQMFRAYTDSELIALVKSNEVKAFDELYRRYFNKLYNHAYEKLHDRFMAQETVQDLFVEFWQKRHEIEISQSVPAYLFISIRNLAINQLKKQLAYQKHTEKFSLLKGDSTNETNEQIAINDLQESYHQALAHLPEKCREVFTLSRNGYSNVEIAEKLGISPKTVEQHITKALRIMRLLLKTHMNLLWLFLFVK
ncbi:RNA polymerase sigma-70 factor [Pseudarcicella hirudinis]|nr:RNA polymerase sigma-70 factor [Pseudarcicella hirudinis]